MLHLFLANQLPGGKNRVHTTRSGHRYPEARFVAWRQDALFELQTQLQGVQGLPYRHPVALQVVYCAKDRRRRDLDAMLGTLGHLLERAGVLADDSLIQALEWQPTGQAKAPCVHMTVKRLMASE